jgi:hypothetical protein
MARERCRFILAIFSFSASTAGQSANKLVTIDCLYCNCWLGDDGRIPGMVFVACGIHVLPYQGVSKG